jgi:hypothetical protein
MENWFLEIKANWFLKNLETFKLMETSVERLVFFYAILFLWNKPADLIAIL